MRNGFTFKDRHSSEFGVTVKTKSRPIRPESKKFVIDLPCRDGEYDFSTVNPQNREHYYNRTFIMTLSLYADSLEKMQGKLAKISRWLIGEGELIFDDMPYVIWHGRVTDEIIYMPEHEGRKAVLEMSFRTEPFGECIFDTNGPMLDSTISIDEKIPIGLDALYVFKTSNGNSIHINNFGDRPVFPVINITGNAGNMTLRMNGKSLDFTAGGNVTVDCEKQIVTNQNGSVMVSGEFPELAVGDNELHIINSNSSTLTIDVSFTPLLIYGIDFEDVDWGDGND